jgi:hypothetical protein
MNAQSIAHFWSAILGSAAILAVVLTALALMVGLVKPEDLPRKLGTILGIFVLLTILPDILVSAWVRISLGQQIALAAIGVVVLIFLLPKRKARSGRKG